MPSTSLASAMDTAAEAARDEFLGMVSGAVVVLAISILLLWWWRKRHRRSAGRTRVSFTAMAVACKGCGARLATSAPTCPKCGVSRPGGATGKLVIARSSAVIGALRAIQVVVDGQPMGEVKNGETLTLDLPAGGRTVEVRGGGMSRTAPITIVEGQIMRYQLYFSAWGGSGGGLKFKPE